MKARHRKTSFAIWFPTRGSRESSYPLGSGDRPHGTYPAGQSNYSLYGHSRFAVGFLTRGCHRRCAFCVVPVKEGSGKQASASFDEFVPRGQRNVILLDDNLLSFEGSEQLLQEMAQRQLAVNFSQTLDISCLTERLYELLLSVNY